MNHYLQLGSVALTVALLAMSSPAEAQQRARNGALVGGAAGAVIGGIIGNNKNDQTAEGALIGGAVGAVAGGVIGYQRDKAIAEQQRLDELRRAHRAPHNYYHSPHARMVSPRYPHTTPSGYRYHPSGPGQPTIIYSTPVVTRQGVYRSPSIPGSATARLPVTLPEVVHMSRSGVSDHVIVSRIQVHGIAQPPSVDDVIYLSQEGVSDDVIAAMQGGLEANAIPRSSSRRGF